MTKRIRQYVNSLFHNAPTFCRLAASLMEASHGQSSRAYLQQTCKAVLACLALEEQPAECDEFAALLGAVAAELFASQVKLVATVLMHTSRASNLGRGTA